MNVITAGVVGLCLAARRLVNCTVTWTRSQAFYVALNAQTLSRRVYRDHRVSTPIGDPGFRVRKPGTIRWHVCCLLRSCGVFSKSLTRLTLAVDAWRLPGFCEIYMNNKTNLCGQQKQP